MKLKGKNLEQITLFAKAMGHPTRMEILTFLLEQEACYFGDIHEVFPNAKATISQHLKELKNVGLIQGEIEGPKVKYCINKDNWTLAKQLFNELFSTPVKSNCC
ncbi:MAG: winged helix-turn-helix transcriptional regulator [Bacteroidales bacterium]|nr:winged helix-turn-helix transcriptional regulator [Bacteroidales bacterium]